MIRHVPNPNAIEMDHLMVQANHLRGDFVARALTLVALTATTWGSSVFPPLVLSLSAFFLTEISQFWIARRLKLGRGRYIRIAFVANAFVAASVFSLYPLTLWRSDLAPFEFVGLGLMTTAIVHCILIRSHHLIFGLTTLAPLVAATGFMLWPMLTATSSEGPVRSVVVCCAIFLGYMLHAAWSQNAAHRTLLRALDAAQAANRAKGRFLTSMSHEIRTPLNGILGIAQIITRNANEAADDEAKELGETLMSSGSILKSMVDDVLDQAKIEAGKMDLHPAPMSLEKLCQSVMRLFEPRAEEKGIVLVSDIAGDVPDWVEADKLRLHQILANLVSNAVKFTDHGEVHLSISIGRRLVSGPGQFDRIDLMIAVRDTGFGMSKEEAAILFDPFTQVGSQVEQSVKGTGLGLPISRDLARLMGGDIGVKSVLGEGSCFTLQIPELTLADGGPQIERNTDAHETTLTGMRILLVEDNRTNRMIARAFLRDTGVEMVEAEDGEVGVTAANHAAFDLVLMDVRMPVMDGLTAFRQIRAAGNTVPIVALTANAMAEDRDEYLSMGMDGYLSKPLDRDALLREIGRFAPRAPSIAAE